MGEAWEMYRVHFLTGPGKTKVLELVVVELIPIREKKQSVELVLPEIYKFKITKCWNNKCSEAWYPLSLIPMFIITS